MSKIEAKDIKDLKKYLSVSDKIKITGRKAWSIPKLGIKRIGNWYKQQKQKIGVGLDKLNDYVAEEKQAQSVKDFVKLAAQKEEVRSYVSRMEQDDSFRKGENQDYLNALKSRISKISKKQIKATHQQYGIFSLSKMAAKKLATDKFHQAQEVVENKKQEVKAKKDHKQAMDIAKNIYRAQEAKKAAEDTIASEFKRASDNGLDLASALEEYAAMLRAQAAKEVVQDAEYELETAGLGR